MGKFLRIVSIILLGLASALILLSGIGTSCVALNPMEYEGYEAIAQYQWLYILYVLSFTGFGIWGIWTTVALVRGKKNAYRNSLILLASSVVVGVIHMATSRALRDTGSSMPVDPVVYAAAFTLLVFLLLGLPKIKQMVGFEEGGSNGKTAGGGMAAMIAGLLFLSVQMWAGPTHIFDGVNLADHFHAQMTIGGGFLFAVGLGTFIYAVLNSVRVRETAEGRISA